MSIFYSPNVESVIECLPSCIRPDNPPPYAPVVYRDLVLEFYSTNYFHQRGYGGDRPIASSGSGR